jgi:hypothetical protein
MLANNWDLMGDWCLDIHFPNGGGVEVGIGLGAAEMTLLNAKIELRMIAVNCMFDSWLSNP